MEYVLGNLQKGLLFVLSAPAGTGKTTLTEMLVSEFPQVIQSVSYTTRKKRGDEIDGKHYNFVSSEEFDKHLADGDFLEHAVIYGNKYGTSRRWVEHERERGRHVVLVIDTQGAKQLMQACEATLIFVMPPSMEVLKERLTKRRTEDQVVIEQRLQWAENEIAVGKKDYQYIIVNHDLKTAYEILKSIFIAEEHRAEHYKRRMNGTKKHLNE